MTIFWLVLRLRKFVSLVGRLWRFGKTRLPCIPDPPVAHPLSSGYDQNTYLLLALREGNFSLCFWNLLDLETHFDLHIDMTHGWIRFPALLVLRSSTHNAGHLHRLLHPRRRTLPADRRRIFQAETFRTHSRKFAQSFHDAKLVQALSIGHSNSRGGEPSHQSM